MRKTNKKLVLRAESLRRLTTYDLRMAHGGLPSEPTTSECTICGPSVFCSDVQTCRCGTGND